MDVKDLELIIAIAGHGVADASFLSSKLSISADNVDRRISLLRRSGIIRGFSAYFDRRMFGYDTTFLKLHYRMKDLDRIIGEVSSMPQIAQVYPNLDDFMMVEVVHWDTDSLKSTIRALERAAKPMTVSAHFRPMLPELIPETPRGKDLEILKYLVNDGRISHEDLSGLVGIPEEKVAERISRMVRDGSISIKAVIQEDLVQPFPTFSTIVTFEKGHPFSTCYSETQRIGRGIWSCLPLEDPSGIWLRSFGKDLHEMDMMIERYRREDFVRDVLVIIPDTMVTKRSVDLNILKRRQKEFLVS
jgi:DNA-binding Lrp family transcriptional regulator